MKLSAKYDTIIQKLHTATYVCDTEGRLKLFNKAAAELWGRQPQIGIDFYCGSWKIIDSSGNEMPIEKHPSAIAIRENKTSDSVEMIIKRPDGSYRNVLHSSMPVYDIKGMFTGVVNMIIDVTNEHQNNMI
jgi:PAS domain-containing protein